MLIDIILLHLASTASNEDQDVTIVPEFTVLKTPFNEKRFFGEVLDHLITKLPSKYTRETAIFLLNCFILSFLPALIISYPMQTLARPDLNQIGTLNIIEAKNLADIRARITQVVLAAAMTCRQRKYVPSSGYLLVILYSVIPQPGMHERCNHQW